MSNIYTTETIRRRALYMLGERHFKNASATEDPVTDLLPDILREANNAGHWSFARKAKRITASGVAGDKKFAMPADLLRVVSVKDADDCYLARDPWEIRGRDICFTQNIPAAITLRYTRDLQRNEDGTATETIDWPDAPAFINYVTTLLAARCATAIIGQAGIQLGANLEAQAQQLFQAALTQDRQQDSSNDQDPTREFWQSDAFGLTSTRRR